MITRCRWHPDLKVAWIYGEQMTMTLIRVNDVGSRLRRMGFIRTTEWEKDGPVLCANLKRKGAESELAKSI